MTGRRPHDDDRTPDLDDYILGYTDGYAQGLAQGYRNGYVACERELAALHRAASEATGAAIRLPQITDMSGTAEALTERAQERESAHAERVRAALKPPCRSLFDNLPDLTKEVA